MLPTQVARKASPPLASSVAALLPVSADGLLPSQLSHRTEKDPFLFTLGGGGGRGAKMETRVFSTLRGGLRWKPQPLEKGHQPREQAGASSTSLPAA